MIERLINENYNKQIDQFGIDDKRSLFIPKEYKQELRFKLLLDDQLALSKMSILDFGCGFGDLIIFLRKNFFNLKYTGCDINENFINKAKETYTENNFFLINSVNDVVDNYDIILISGTFNNIGLDEKAAKEYIFESLLKLFHKTNYLLTINFLNHTTDPSHRAINNVYINPTEFYDFALKHMTKRIKIDTASLPYEVTIKLYKNENLDPKLVLYND